MSPLLTLDEVRGLMARGARVVDVRSEAEFASGHAPGSLNLPMHLVPRVDAPTLPRDRPLILCCQSGARSAMAALFLARQGYEVHDLGPWTRLPDPA